MSLNIFNTVIGTGLYRSCNVTRFNGDYLLQPESVAEHSYMVSFLCLALGKELESECGSRIDFGVLLEKAILHDIEESLSSDLPRPFKYSSEEFRLSVEKASESVMESSWSDNEFHRHVFSVWKDAKKQDNGFALESLLVSSADFLDAGLKIFREYRMLGNSGMKQIYYEFMDKNFPILQKKIEESDVLSHEERSCLREVLRLFYNNMMKE